MADQHVQLELYGKDAASGPIAAAYGSREAKVAAAQQELRASGRFRI